MSDDITRLEVLLRDLSVKHDDAREQEAFEAGFAAGSVRALYEEGKYVGSEPPDVQDAWRERAAERGTS